MSLSTVLTMGFLPAQGASSGQIVLMGYSATGEPPPPPPPEETGFRYGPALTPEQRRRWFGDDEEDPIRESPLVKQAKREARERLGRIEIGLLPPDPTPEQKEEVEEALETVIDKKVAKEPQPRSRVDAEKIAKKVALEIKQEASADLKSKREALQKDLEEEEREAMAILSGLLLSWND